MIVQSLLTGGGVHQGAGNIGEGGGLVGHSVGNDGFVVGSHGDGLPQGGVLSNHGDVHVVPCGRHGQADTVGSFIVESGDGQIVFQPQVLHVGNEQLGHVNLTGLQSQLGSGVVGIDVVRQVLGNRQLAPHGLVLAPVVVVTDQDDLLIIGIVLGVGAAPDNIFTGIVQDLGGVVVVALAQGGDPGSLGDGSAGQEVLNLQGVDGLAVLGQLGGDNQGLVAGGFHAFDVGLEAGAGAVVGQDANVPGGNHVSGGDGGSVGPVSGILQGDGHGGQVLVPLVRIGQQGLLLTGQEVEHKQGFEHHGAVATGVTGDGHGVVLVGANGVPAVDGAPLLTCKIQGLFPGQGDVAGRSSDCDSADHSNGQQHREKLGHFLHDESSFYFVKALMGHNDFLTRSSHQNPFFHPKG